LTSCNFNPQPITLWFTHHLSPVGQLAEKSSYSCDFLKTLISPVDCLDIANHMIAFKYINFLQILGVSIIPHRFFTSKKEIKKIKQWFWLVTINNLFSTKRGFLCQLTYRWWVENNRSVIVCELATMVLPYLCSKSIAVIKYLLFIYIYLHSRQVHMKMVLWYFELSRIDHQIEIIMQL
jgi:hypothetical protein